MAFNGITLPDITEQGLSGAAERRQILEALYQLNQQLRYMMDNIGVENLDPELLTFVEETGQKTEQFAREMEDAHGNLSRVIQTARAIELRISGQSRVYRQGGPPTPSAHTPVEDGDLWVDTDEENAVYRWENGEWHLTEGTSIEERMARAESSIVQNADSIRLRVEKNGIVSAINQSAETVSIEARRINFNGAISANGNFRINTDGTVEAVNGRFGGELTADVTYCNSLQFRSGAEMRIGQWHIGYQGIYYPSGYGYNYLAFLYQGGQAYVTAQAHMTLGPDPTHNLNVTGNAIGFSITSNYFGVEMTTLPNYNHLSFVPKTDRTCNLGCGPVGGANSRMWDYAAIRYIYCTDGVHSGSSRVIKRDIHPLPDQGAVIDALTPVTFILKDDPDGREQLGLIYEDTVEVAPLLCSQRIAGDPYTAAINYSRVGLMAVQEAKALRRRVSELEGRLSALEAKWEGKG